MLSGGWPEIGVPFALIVNPRRRLPVVSDKIVGHHVSDQAGAGRLRRGGRELPERIRLGQTLVRFPYLSLYVPSNSQRTPRFNVSRELTL